MTIKQSVLIETTPDNVYRALLSAKQFSQITGAVAEIADIEGGAFSCFGGQITGRHVELMPNKRIVQAWRAKPWPDGHYSIVRLDISESGTASEIELEHSAYPEDGEEHLEGGWHRMYWDPLKAYLG